MTTIGAIILGIIEGATEFIPVSSTGHLILAREILGINNIEGLAFDAVLQFSATIALVVYFWKDLLNIFLTFIKMITRQNIEVREKTLLFSILLGTIPAIILGLLLEEKMETVFRNTTLVGVTLILGSLLFFVAEKFAKQNKSLTLGRGIIIGFFQSLALVPGISRSGATISGGLLSGLSKDEAVRFSFILSIPILLGSGLKKILEVKSQFFDPSFITPLVVGGVVSFTVGLLSINFLIKYLKTHNLNVFIVYRIILALFIFVFL